MVQLGYAISSEEFKPLQLVENARRAEEIGFSYALISDHFHPWLDSQGESPFVWSVIGAIAQATERLELGTGVTCPLIRTHPVVIAQAVATAAAMMPGRFFFGVGTGEYLNEHVTGEHWPVLSTRQEMLREAVELIRKLWEGEYTTHTGRYYRVENARIYTLPETPTPIYIGASGKESGELAGQIGDGLISTAPDVETSDAFSQSGGLGKPKYGQLTVCWAEDERAAKDTALKMWANSAIPGQLGQELALPLYFQQAAQLVTTESIAKAVVCGPDPAPYHAKIKEFADAGFTHVYLHQVGHDQEGFFQFAAKELLPAYAS